MGPATARAAARTASVGNDKSARGAGRVWQWLRTHTLSLALPVLVGSCVAGDPAATALSFDESNVGDPGSDARAEFYAPTGVGRFPAVVVLHGCDGVTRHYRDWARQLRDWGYIAMLVDSFRPRGRSNICNHGAQVPALLRAADAFAAARYLEGLADVRADRIGIIGFSHGSGTVLKAVLASTVQQDHARPFAAAVAFYPGCDPPGSPLATDTLILIGDADDWTPMQRCRRWSDEVARAGHTMQMNVYPGALHGFDAPRTPHFYAGHYVGGDPPAAADALAETRAFLRQRLMP